MMHTVEQLIASTQAHVHTLRGLMTHTFMGLEKLTKANAAFTRGAIAGAFSHGQELLDVKNPQQLLALQVGLLKPLTEKSSAYAWEAYAVAFDLGTELSKAAEVQLAETHKLAFEAMESLAQNAPIGSESALTALKSAINAGQEAIVAAQGSAKKAVELAESSFANMRQQTAHAGNATAKTH